MKPPPPDLTTLATQGDKPADDVVVAVQKRRGPAVVFALMREVLAWPPESGTSGLDPDIAAFLKQGYAIPDWVRPERVLAAQKNYVVHRNVARAVLATYSLPSLYVDPDIALALVGTGQLALHVRSRLQGTQDFIDAVMTPGALVVPGTSWCWVRKVRLSHAVRRAIANLSSQAGSGAADLLTDHRRHDPFLVLHRKTRYADRPDDPVNQVELAYTLLTFSWVIADGVNRLGYGLSTAEHDDHLHAWALVGHMLGIVDELLPGRSGTGVDEAKQLFDAIRNPLIEAGDPFPQAGVLPAAGVEEGRQLMAALMVVLVDVARESIPDWLRPHVERFRWLDNTLQDVPRVLVYKLAGTATGRMLHLTPAPLLHWIICRIALRVIDLRTWKADVQPEILP